MSEQKKKEIDKNQIIKKENVFALPIRCILNICQLPKFQLNDCKIQVYDAFHFNNENILVK